MRKNIAICHICGNTTEGGGEAISLCSVCGADLINSADELVLKKKSDFLYKKWDGLLVLTNKRFLLIKNPIVATMAGIFGEIAASKQADALTKQGERVVFSLLPDEIASVEITKYGWRGQMLTIEDSNGTQYQIALPKKLMDEWLDAITQFKSTNI